MPRPDHAAVGSVAAADVVVLPGSKSTVDDLRWLRETGLADRVERRVMDLGETGNDVEAADYVVLNRVICCYPDMQSLLAPAKINFLPAHPKVAPDPDLAAVLKQAKIIEIDDSWAGGMPTRAFPTCRRSRRTPAPHTGSSMT